MNARVTAVAVWLLVAPAGFGLVGETRQAGPYRPETRVGAAQASGAAQDGWRQMQGSWSATGRRQTLSTGSGRPAATMQLSGAVVLAVGDGLSHGFRGEFIGFDDGGTLAVGRWMWTDERGDQVFGVVKGEPLETGRRFVGTITGGSGRYAGITGEYEFTWQSVVEAEGMIQGRTTALKGRYRRGGGRRP